MSILHRIFVSKYKHKKLYKKQRTAYKKFLGLKTVTGVLATSLSRLSSASLPKKLPKLAVKKLISNRPQPRLRFSILRLLPAQARRGEVISAQNDLDNFINVKDDEPPQSAPEKFQAFLPRPVWVKMTAHEKRMHITKRKLLAAKRYNIVKTSKYGFSNKRSRPLLAKITFKGRRQYLKDLLKFVRMSNTSRAIPPFDKHNLTRFKKGEVRFAITLSKNNRLKNNILKNLTCVSVIPTQVSNLTL